MPPEVYTVSFGGDVKPSVPGDLLLKKNKGRAVAGADAIGGAHGKLKTETDTETDGGHGNGRRKRKYPSNYHIVQCYAPVSI